MYGKQSQNNSSNNRSWIQLFKVNIKKLLSIKNDWSINRLFVFFDLFSDRIQYINFGILILNRVSIIFKKYLNCMSFPILQEY